MNKTPRYLALDVLRGMTVALMILVNNPGSWSHIYAPLRHAAWDGCTPTDLVFPFFLFVVGVSIFFAFAKYGDTLNRDSLMKIGRRTLLIFAIGLFLHSFPQWDYDFAKLRIPGVLQRIAICYGIASVLVLSFSKRTLIYISVAILLVYWMLTILLGGPEPFTLEGNPAAAIDIAVFGVAHIYKGFGVPFDPEGLFSTLPAIVTVLAGYLIGWRVKVTPRDQLLKQLFIIGAAGVAAGWIWGMVVPICKPLWSSSYVVYTAGWAVITLAVLIWIIDFKGITRWSNFFVVFGMNPLFIFALSGLWARVMGRMIHVTLPDGKEISGSSWFYNQLCVPLAGELNGSLLYAIAHVVLFWLLGYILYKRKIFIKV